MNQEVVPLGAVPWEMKTPKADVCGFKQAVGLFEINLGYRIYDEAVMLYAFVQMPSAPAQIWRRHWTSHEAALAAAENLCGDAMEYLGNFKSFIRPTEDLDYEDYIEHLRVRLSNNFH